MEILIDWSFQLLMVQVFGTYHCATSIARRWMEKGTGGSIVFTASMTSYRPNRVCVCPYIAY